MDISNNSLGAAICRICMCGETSIPYLGKQGGEPLISPCCCSGTMGLYHRSCLEHWLTLTKTKNCEICKFVFKVAQKPRGVIEYFRMKGYKKHRNNYNNRNPFVDFSFILIITPLAVMALSLCLRGASIAGRKYHVAYENRHNDEEGRNLQIRNESSMECALFVFLCFVLFLAYSIFFSVLAVNHYSQYKRWQRKNMILFVVDQLDAEQSMHYNPHFNRRLSLGRKLANSWRRLRGAEENPIVSEIARSEATTIEQLVGISPVLVTNFNQTSADSDNTHNHDASRNAIPFCVRSPENGQLFGNTSPPQMYSSEKYQQCSLSAVGLIDLHANFPSSRVACTSTTSINDLTKTQSVYSVCSFGNGVTSCSTPIAERHMRIHSNEITLSTFKSPIPPTQPTNETMTIESSP